MKVISFVLISTVLLASPDYAQMQNSTAQILFENADAKERSMGTCFSVKMNPRKDNPYIKGNKFKNIYLMLTATHVIQSKYSNVEVRKYYFDKHDGITSFKSVNIKDETCSVVFFNIYNDISFFLLYTDENFEFNSLELSPQRVAIGDTIYIPSCAAGIPGLITNADVALLNFPTQIPGPLNNNPVHLINRSLTLGASGSPVINNDGYVVGVISIKMQYYTGASYMGFQPMDKVLRIIDNEREN